MTLPARKKGNGREAIEWNRMVDCLKSLAPVRGGGVSVTHTPTGSIHSLPQLPKGWLVVYVKCCLEDASTAYLPVLTRGPIYTTNTGTTVPVTVIEGDVPDGQSVLS